MKRVTYIDSAKGLCMLMIVCSHVGASVPIPMFHTAQTSAFFLLSGYFFKINGTFYERAKASAVRLLLPFAVFYVLSYLFFYLGIAVVPGFSEMTDARGVLDCYTQKQYLTDPYGFYSRYFGYK